MTTLIPRGSAARLASVVVLLSCACRTSPDPRLFGPAHSPTGVTGSVSVAGAGDVAGELLTVTDTGYVMLVKDRLTFAPFSVLNAASFNHVGRVTTLLGQVPEGKKRQRLKLYSRFPYGIPEPAMSALLAKSGQSALDNVRLTR